MSISLIKKNDIIIIDNEIMNLIKTIISYLNIQNNNNKKKPLLILGPSGVGKDTMINILLKKYPKIFYKLPSYTTRKMRPGEKEGVDYFFITKEEFEKMKNEKKLFGIQKYNDNFYASNKSKLEELVKKGDKIIILNYNIETVEAVKDEIDFNFVAILPPCEAELKNRLEKRGTNKTEMEKRMESSLREMRLINEANYIKFRVINDEINKCFEKLENHIKEIYPDFFRHI